jgi:tetrahydromethanopterin S-methyltransferase subunit F
MLHDNQSINQSITIKALNGNSYQTILHNYIHKTRKFISSDLFYFSGQILASSRPDSNGLFAAGISGLVIGLLSIMLAVSLVVICRKLCL